MTTTPAGALPPSAPPSSPPQPSVAVGTSPSALEPPKKKSVTFGREDLSHVNTEIPTLQLLETLMKTKPELKDFKLTDICGTSTTHVKGEGPARPVLDGRGKPVIDADGKEVTKEPMKVESWVDSNGVLRAKVPLDYTFTMKNAKGEEVEVHFQQSQYTTIPLPVRGTPQEVIDFQAKMTGVVIAVRVSFGSDTDIKKRVDALYKQTKLTLTYNYEDMGSKFYGHHVFRDETKSKSLSTITQVCSVSLGQMAKKNEFGKYKIGMTFISPVSCEALADAEKERSSFEAHARQGKKDPTFLTSPEWVDSAGAQNKEKLTALLRAEIRKAEECLENIKTAELKKEGDRVTASLTVLSPDGSSVQKTPEGSYSPSPADTAVAGNYELTHIKEKVQAQQQKVDQAKGRNEKKLAQVELTRLQEIDEATNNPTEFAKKITAIDEKIAALQKRNIAIQYLSKGKYRSLATEKQRLVEIQEKPKKIAEAAAKTAPEVDREVTCLGNNLEELNKALAAIDVLINELKCGDDPKALEALKVLRQKLDDAKYEEVPSLIQGFAKTMEAELKPTRVGPSGASLAPPTIQDPTVMKVRWPASTSAPA